MNAIRVIIVLTLAGEKKAEVSNSLKAYHPLSCASCKEQSSFELFLEVCLLMYLIKSKCPGILWLYMLQEKLRNPLHTKRELFPKRYSWVTNFWLKVFWVFWEFHGETDQLICQFSVLPEAVVSYKKIVGKECGAWDITSCMLPTHKVAWLLHALGSCLIEIQAQTTDTRLFSARKSYNFQRRDAKARTCAIQLFSGKSHTNHDCMCAGPSACTPWTRGHCDLGPHRSSLPVLITVVSGITRDCA